MIRRVAFFRGVNVGGHNRVPMAELREVFTQLGYTGVGSVIQSGNVVFDSAATDSEASVAISDAVRHRFDLRVPITLRTADAFAAAVEAHPFPPGEVEAKFHHIMFLTEPAPGDAAERLGERADNDDFAVIGSEVHVRYNQGSARARFNVGWVDGQLATVATARNLATCQKVADLIEAPPAR